MIRGGCHTTPKDELFTLQVELLFFLALKAVPA